MEENRDARNKPMHMQPSDSHQMCQKHTLEEASSIQ
jgi:hypothetical protein